MPGWEAARRLDGSVQRWGGALPQYLVGHRELVARTLAGVAEVPGLAVAGAVLDGVGIAACLASADRAAAQIAAGLSAERHGSIGPHPAQDVSEREEGD